jgi:hypothetical protein
MTHGGEACNKTVVKPKKHVIVIEGRPNPKLPSRAPILGFHIVCVELKNFPGKSCKLQKGHEPEHKIMGVFH